MQDLGHEDPTILLTNQSDSPTKLLTRSARRMLIENSLSDAVRSFHMDALSSTVGLKVDFEMALLVIASGLYRLVAPRIRGYADAHPSEESVLSGGAEMSGIAPNGARPVHVDK